jgi:dynein heavy chain
MDIGLFEIKKNKTFNKTRKLIFFRYDRKDTTKITLEDIQFVSAMGPPGGGRNVVTPRFIRHFVTIAINPFTDETLTKIFSTLFSVYIRVYLRKEFFFK